MIDIKTKVHDLYWKEDLNCAKTMLTCLSQNYKIHITPQVMDSAIGMAGACQFGAQCGLVEGGLLFLGIYFSNMGRPETVIRGYCHDYAQEFQSKFGSLTCQSLRPEGFSTSNPPHLCERITCEAVEFAIGFINRVGNCKSNE